MKGKSWVLISLLVSANAFAGPCTRAILETPSLNRLITVLGSKYRLSDAELIKSTHVNLDLAKGGLDLNFFRSVLKSWVPETIELYNSQTQVLDLRALRYRLSPAYNEVVQAIVAALWMTSHRESVWLTLQLGNAVEAQEIRKELSAIFKNVIVVAVMQMSYAELDHFLNGFLTPFLSDIAPPSFVFDIGDRFNVDDYLGAHHARIKIGNGEAFDGRVSARTGFASYFFWKKTKEFALKRQATMLRGVPIAQEELDKVLVK